MTQFYTNPYFNYERASASNSEQNTKQTVRGSVTVEAAMTIPIFFFAVLTLVYLLEMQAIQFSIDTAMHGAAKNAAEDVAIVSVLNPVKIKSDIVNLVGANRLERSIVKGGSAGIHCWKSSYHREKGEITIRVEYRIKLPFPPFVKNGVACKEQLLVKDWTGNRRPESTTDDEQIVYITKNGLVYHEAYHCSYLQPTIQFVPYEEMLNLRNEDGGKYHPCETCVHGSAMAGVYITDYGYRYHNSLDCGGLKRTIYAVKKGECKGRHGCSKCTS